jgi:hypothetical protein
MGVGFFALVPVKNPAWAKASCNCSCVRLICSNISRSLALCSFSRFFHSCRSCWIATICNLRASISADVSVLREPGVAVAFDSVEDSACLIEFCLGISSVFTVVELFAVWEFIELNLFIDPWPGVVTALDIALVVVTLEAGLVMLDDGIPVDLPFEL